MKHTIEHDLSDSEAKLATERAIAQYRERYAEYEPFLVWRDPRRAELGFSVKGVKLAKAAWSSAPAPWTWISTCPPDAPLQGVQRSPPSTRRFATSSKRRTANGPREAAKPPERAALFRYGHERRPALCCSTVSTSPAKVRPATRLTPVLGRQGLSPRCSPAGLAVAPLSFYGASASWPSAWGEASTEGSP